MPNFNYTAYTAEGMMLRRQVNAPSASAARRLVLQSGQRLVSMRSVTERQRRLYRTFPTLFRVKRGDLIMFSRQLAACLRVGVPITEAIRLLQDKSAKPAFRAVLDEVCDDLEGGERLSVALARHPNIFDALYVDMVRAAEASGQLDKVMDQIAAYAERQEGALKKLRSALIYPIVVLSLAFVVSLILIFFVLPNFVALFNDFHAELPLPTRILLGVGGFASRYRLPLGLGVAAGLAGILYFGLAGGARSLRDDIVTRLPILGPVIVYTAVERFTRTLATLLSGGIPIGQTLEAAIAATGNRRFEKGLRAVQARMITGDGFSGPLEDTGLFPAMVIRMVRIGEETGTLDKSLVQIAEFLREETDYKVRDMISLVEPTMVIAVGTVVGFIALSVISPMYGLLKAIH